MSIEITANPSINAALANESQAPHSDAVERVLIDRARNDAHAFGNIYRQHAPAIANYLQRRTRDAHAAEDLLSETFLAAMKALPRFRFNGVPLRFWLYRLATNAANRWMRTNARRSRRERVVAIAADLADASPGDRSPDSPAVRALSTLAPKHQTVLTLHAVEGLTLEQVSIVLGCRVGTVKSRLFRARESLRMAIERQRAASSDTTSHC